VFEKNVFIYLDLKEEVTDNLEHYTNIFFSDFSHTCLYL